ncbi:MAG TPA: ABC transporter permease [Rickettsiales bacterium]|nr:ABC transporter permease [Rickettsiales bacterium]
MEFKYFIDGGILNVSFIGDFVNYRDGDIYESFVKETEDKKFQNIVINGNKLGKWDSTLVVIIYKILHNNIDSKVDISTLPESLQRLLKLSFSTNRNKTRHDHKRESIVEKIGDNTFNDYTAVNRGIRFFLSIFKSLGKLITGKAIMRRVDFLFALEECGYKALPIVCLISFMVGLILAFVGASQLKVFGTQIYVANLVAIGMVRIMGPAMAGVIMAGRTGASYTATIGTMQVNDEINALKTMGIPIMDFLTLPRFLALTLMMPILSVFADIVGIIGGASVGTTMLGIPFEEYYKLSMKILNLKHFLVGIFHGWVYGWVISLCGCYYGIYCGKDAESVGRATTMSVVSSIVWIVITTGIITFICQLIKI